MSLLADNFYYYITLLSTAKDHLNPLFPLLPQIDKLLHTSTTFWIAEAWKFTQMSSLWTN